VVWCLRASGNTQRAMNGKKRENTPREAIYGKVFSTCQNWECDSHRPHKKKAWVSKGKMRTTEKRKKRGRRAENVAFEGEAKTQ